MDAVETWSKIVGWVENNIPLVVIIFTFVIQITPIKWNPWSQLFKWIGKLINTETDKKINDLIDSTKKLNKKLEDETQSLDNKITGLHKMVDENEKDRIRYEVLDFANSCHNNRRHTKDEFEHIIALNDKYDILLQRTGDKNGIYKAEYEYLMKLYKKLQLEGGLIDEK